jgi:putative phage-type endonuclease
MDIDMATVADDTLVNIIDSFTVPSVFSSDEEIMLVETAYSLINDLLEREPMLYIQPYFHDSVILEVTDLLLQQLNDVMPYDIEDELTLCIEQAMKLFYQQVAPKRSFHKTFIRIKPNLAKLREKIIYLQNVPQPEQRTAAWYNFRYKYLTASSIWKAFISESTRNQLIYDKCKPLNVEKYSHTSMDSPMHWGHKYEPVSVQLYEYLYKTAVSDFGCIPHATLDFLAASPDGINTLETSDRYGRMLEIKNIVNRDIDGVPKMEYWIQMQLQLEVCNLNECDFLETRFKEYADEEAYLLDSYREVEVEDANSLNVNKTQEGQQKGMMIQFIVHGQPFYEYAPLNATKAELTAWEAAMMEKHHNHMWCKNIYWWLDELSCVLVLRNKFWFKAAVPILTDLWKTIEHEKNHGYEHRSPNKKVKMDSAPNVLSGKCLIDLSEMMDMAMDENEHENNSEVTLDTNKVFTFEPKPHNSETKVLKLDTNVLTLDTNVLTIDTNVLTIDTEIG